MYQDTHPEYSYIIWWILHNTLTKAGLILPHSCALLGCCFSFSFSSFSEQSADHCLNSNPWGLTHWAIINSCHQNLLFPCSGQLGLSVDPTVSLTQSLPPMQQCSYSSKEILHLTLLSRFLSLLPSWSHSHCTLTPIQLLIASAASIACAEVLLPCGKKKTCLVAVSPPVPGWHSAVTRCNWGCKDDCPGMCGCPMPCQKVWHEMSDPDSPFPPTLISRGFQQQRGDSWASSPFHRIIES